MQDVAKRAGVSLKTVSRVINGQPNVSAKVCELVRTAASELSYMPDVHAGNLRRSHRSPETIGVIVENIGSQFWADIVRAVEDVAISRNVTISASSHDGKAQRELGLVDRFLRHRVDGLIVATIATNQDHLVQEQRYGTPIVFIDRQPFGIAADTVMNDFSGMATDATEYLLDQGHRRIAYLGDRPALPTARERLAAYTRVMTSAGVSVEPELVREGVRSAAEGCAATLELVSLPAPPTAILATKDQIAEGMLRALHRRGLHRRIAHMAIGDLPMADLINPSLTAINQDPRSLGALAATRVFARLEGDASAPQLVHVPHKLVARGSGEIAPA
jgi:LacI family transcriptional regulator